MTILKHCWSSPKKSPPLYIPQQNTYQNLRQQIFFFRGYIGLVPEKKKKKTAIRVSASAVVQGAIKQYFLLLLPSQPLYRAEHCCCCPVLLLFFSSQPKKKKKKGHLSTVGTDIVNGPFPRWRFKDVIENLYSFPSFDVVLEQFPSQLFLLFLLFFLWLGGIWLPHLLLPMSTWCTSRV